MAALSLTRLALLVRDARRLSTDLADAVGERDLLLVASQHRYQALIEQLPGIVYNIVPADDGTASVLYISPRVEDVMGITVDACLMDIDTLARGIHPDDRAGSSRRAPLVTGRPATGRVSLSTRPTGSGSGVRDDMTVIDGPAGERVLQGILLDITEDKRAEAERERMELELRLAQKLEAVGQLAAGIAHEINTPIQFVGDTVRSSRDCFDDLQRLLGDYRDACAAATAGGPAARRCAPAERADDEADLDYLQERLPAGVRAHAGRRRARRRRSCAR